MDSARHRRSTVPTFAAVFVIMAGLFTVMTLAAVSQTERLAEQTRRLYRHPLTVSNAALATNAHIIAIHRHMKDVVLARSAAVLDAAVAHVNRAEAAVFKRFEAVKARFLGDQKVVEAALAAFIAWRPIRARVIALTRQQRYDEAAAITKGVGAEHVAHLTAAMDAMIAFARNKADSFLATTEAEAQAGPRTLWRWFAILLGLMALTAAITIGRVRRAERAEAASTARYRALFESAQVAMLVYDLRPLAQAVARLRPGADPATLPADRLAPVAQVNSAALALFGVTRQEDLLRTYRQVGGEAVLRAAAAALMDGRSEFQAEIEFQRADGAAVHAIVSAQLPRDPQLLETVPVSLTDITERKARELSLRLAASVFEHADEGIVITDPQARIVDCNVTFERLTGYTRAELLGCNPSMLSSGRHDRAFFQAMWAQLLGEGRWQGELWNRHKGGQVYPVMTNTSTVRNAAGEVVNYLALYTDIAALKAHQRELQRLAHFDALTGLPNRVLLGDRLQAAMAQADQTQTQLAVAYIDLDGFKAVNDRYGHPVGDAFLEDIAQRMRSVLRKADTLARLGGDEFVAILGDLTSWLEAQPMLDRLLRVCAEPTTVGDTLVVDVSASVGVSLYPQDAADTPDQLLRQADQAMYQAKLTGRSRYQLYDPSQDLRAQARAVLAADVARGLAAGEFRLHFQPTVHMSTGEIVGVEALIRWAHPTRGLLLPGAFLPLIEALPVVAELDEWVLGAALQQADAWLAEGRALSVNINLTARLLLRGDFPAVLGAALAAHPAVHPNRLRLEIVETTALADLDLAARTIERCTQLGVRFALDDFGTGYSSLTHLQRLPVSQIKIDRSFVRDLPTSGDPTVRAVVGLANTFGLECVAEGVESPEHGLALLALGCHLAQGFGIARPMPAEALPGWCEVWRPDPRWLALRPVARLVTTPVG